MPNYNYSSSSGEDEEDDDIDYKEEFNYYSTYKYDNSSFSEEQDDKLVVAVKKNSLVVAEQSNIKEPGIDIVDGEVEGGKITGTDEMDDTKDEGGLLTASKGTLTSYMEQVEGLRQQLQHELMPGYWLSTGDFSFEAPSNTKAPSIGSDVGRERKPHKHYSGLDCGPINSASMLNLVEMEKNKCFEKGYCFDLEVLSASLSEDLCNFESKYFYAAFCYATGINRSSYNGLLYNFNLQEDDENDEEVAWLVTRGGLDLGGTDFGCEGYGENDGKLDRFYRVADDYEDEVKSNNFKNDSVSFIHQLDSHYLTSATMQQAHPQRTTTAEGSGLVGFFVIP